MLAPLLAVLVLAVLVLAVLVLASCAAPVTTPVGHRPFYGLNEPNASLSRERQLSRDVGVRPTVFSAFIRLDTTTTAQKMTAMHAAGLTPFITLEPWHLGARNGVPDPRDSLRHLLAGEFDAQLLEQARMLATYKAPFYLRFAHEMNAGWYPWGIGVDGNTAADYVRSWRHVHQLFDHVPGLHARWVWSPVAVQNPGASSELAPLYPGDDVVDYVGLTGYEHADAQPAATFDPTITRLHALTHLPIVLSEIGSDGKDKTTWLAALGTYLRTHPGIAGFVYFDTSPASTGATGTYSLDDATERAAFARGLRALRPSPSGKDRP
ncbi:glycoside hydrolase family 26 protein [uncultured Jatrophihabitans sp.]|uniref:glycoside hydrolase family 26 protein n=1 Tax=uncultured Jatrophihabitans sp. TaxID=1610747 RepID=UPI0035CBBD17